ncbi:MULTISPECIES: PqiC family protein [unclassified Luteibacter]|uniref:PqiC family protein n=1 Tax=Luteibacter sp. PvP019 TaxID=3156436 RepID=UPI00339527C3
MIRIGRLTCVGALGLMLGACASAPVRYYTLLGSAPPARSPTASNLWVNVGPVGVPSDLDQQAMVVRQSATRVDVLDSEQWASPLGEEVRSAVSAQISSRLGAPDLHGLAAADGKPGVRVSIQLRRFEAWLGSRVLLQADWALTYVRDGRSDSVMCSGQFEAAATDTYPGLVHAGQQVVVQMADRIANRIADLERHGNVSAAPCNGGGRTLE